MESEETQNVRSCGHPEECTEVRALKQQLHALRLLNSRWQVIAGEQKERIRQLHALNVDTCLLYLGMALSCFAYYAHWPASLRGWPCTMAAGIVIGRWVGRFHARRRKEKP